MRPRYAQQTTIRQFDRNATDNLFGERRRAALQSFNLDAVHTLRRARDECTPHDKALPGEIAMAYKSVGNVGMEV